SDAVNKGQLDAATTASSSKTDALGNSTATNLGGGSKYDNSTGAISAPSYVTTKTDGTTTTANNVGDALTNLNTEVVKPVTFTGNSGTVDRKLGETLNITGGLTGAGSNSNIKTVITGNTLDIQLADAPVFAGKVKANGLDANGNKVENVADATAASDAVNKGQLDAATTASSSKTDALGNSTATNLGGGSKYDNSTGAISAPSYVTTKTDGTTTTANNVGDALTNLNTEVVKPVTFTGNSGTVDRKLGETLNITGGLTGAGSNSNIKTVITGNTLDIQLADAPVFAGKVKANGLDANGNKVENVADATAASDAVNKGQLDSLSTGLTNTGFGLKAADGNTVNKKLGEAVEVVGADSNITTKVANGQVAIELNKNLNNLTGITVNDGTNGTNGSTVIGKDGISVKDGSGNTIVGLDNTALTVKDGSGNTETSINKAINTLNASQGETDKFAVKYDKNADGSANYDSVTLAGTGGTTITNVKAGAINATSTDAINGSQLYDVGNSLKNAIGGLTTRDATTGIITTSNIGGTGSNTIDGAINSIKDSATKAKTTVTAGDNVVVTAGTNADGSSNYQVATAKDVNFDKVTVGNVVVNKASNTIEGLSNTDLRASDFATKGRAATEEQLKQAVTKNITEVVDGNGNKVNIIDQVVNTKPDNKNQDSLFLTYDKQGQETTDRLTIGQTVQKMNTDGIKFFHTNADMSKGDLGTTNDSSAGGLNSTAIGVNAIVATGADSAVALGHNTKAEGKQSIAIGQGAEALGTQSISIGTGNKVKGNHSGAIGDPTIVDGANSYSVGNNNQVLTDDTFVLGNNVTKTVAGSVVLGNGSAATTGAGVVGYALSAATSADKTAISNTTSTTGAVAVGDAASGIYRQITGVAAGSADADAVNVAQLKAVGNQVVTTQNALVNGLGGNAKVNADGTITGPTYNVAQGNQSNVGDALTALDKAIGSAATTSKTTVSNGQNIVVNKSKNADGSDNYEVSTAKDLTVDSVKAGDTVLNNAGISIGNNAVVINNTGLTIAGGPSVTVAGINAGNKTITNVANAVNATDAVNKGQLDSAIGTVNNNVNELANNAVKYDDASKDKITLGGGTNGTTISNVKDGAVSQGSKDAVNGGQLWNVQQQVDQNSTDISNIKNDINNGTVGLVQQAGKDATVTVAKDTGGTSVSVAGTDGNRVVTGVKDGAVNATSKDAVNGSQLNTTNQAVVNYLGGGAGYDNITGSFTAPTYNVGDSKYNNVGGAIDALNQADQALNSKIDNVSNKLDNAFRITNNRIDDVEKKANAGIAAAMALESAPYIPGKYTYAAGAAYHGGENAVGVTLRKTADNGRWSITGGVAAASQGDPSVRIGISGVID
ncbi:YadA-like family protein, partial [Acinetobacter guillouiae]|uniref:YadA-like family protein n=1 Tax=Acinetobacter guillouiae TaxID=106649 RepID=UPI0028D60328